MMVTIHAEYRTCDMVDSEPEGSIEFEMDFQNSGEEDLIEMAVTHAAMLVLRRYNIPLEMIEISSVHPVRFPRH